MRNLKTVELDALPKRDGGPDQLHDHLSFGYNEDCGACAQVTNDFTWARFNDSVDPAEWEDLPSPVERFLEERDRELVAVGRD